MRWLISSTVGLAVGLALLAQAPTVAQDISGDVILPTRLTIAARTSGELTQWNAQIGQMAQAGDLAAVSAYADPAIPGRRHETLRQFYRGVPVEGGGVTRQMAGPVTISAFGTIHSGIDIDPTPALSPGEAAGIIETASGRELVAASVPALVVWPTPTGRYVLAYRGTSADAVTYYLDANTGRVLYTRSEIVDAVGSGTGALGDTKKIATTGVAGGFRAQDTLRPSGVSTYDTRGSDAAFDRMISGGVAFDSDFATDSDNIWTDGRVVDAHVHTGWTLDYFFKQHQWSGLDGMNGPVSDIVHRNLRNNALFAPPPFGPGRRGVMAFGETTGGVPITSLDIAGHELAHGVTHFSVSRRTGQGLVDILQADGLGPTTFTQGGTVFSCNTTVLISNGVQRPFLCSGGRYVLASNHVGAVNEAFSDVFGTGVEFFFQQPGTGQLRADYRISEDVAGFGPIRTLDSPASLTIPTDTGTIPYPDHFNRLFSYALVLVSGTQANPISVSLAPVFFSNGAQVLMFTRGTDDGGVHQNSTILGHAFFLAVEGGRNATSGISVSGVGAQNRALVERAFFRAMVHLMPNSPSLSVAALAVYQAAVDLYGASSATAQTIGQAMVAVGLLVPA